MDEATFDFSTSPADDINKVSECVQEKLAEAKANISDTGFVRLSKIIQEHIDAFGYSIGGCSLSDLTPLDVQLKPGAVPCVAKARHLGPAQTEYLKERLGMLEQLGILTRIKDSNWSSAVFVVPKPGSPGKFRMVIDLRPLNSRVLPTALPMPNLEAQFLYLKGATCFGIFDILSGFDLLRCTKEASQYFVIATVYGLFRLNCCPQGFCNSGQIFHHRMVDEVLGDLWQSHVIQWLDDSLLFASTEAQYLDALEVFLQRVKSKKLKLSVTKCTFFAHKVEFCGREIHFHDGKLQLDFAARFYQSLLDIGVPTTASELAQAIYMCNWLSPALYNLAAIIYPFRLMLDSIHKARGTKKNRGLVGTSLATFGWSAEHTAAWKTLLNSIVSRVKCTTYDPGKELCLFTDASNTHFAAVITQCTSESLSPPLITKHTNRCFS